MEEIQQEEKKHNGNDIFHIKEKIYEMILYGNPQLKDFPKTERYVLAGDIRKTMYTMLEMAVRLEKKYHKKTTLQDLDIEVDVLRNLLRLAKDPNLYPNQKPCLNFHTWEVWMRKVDEIGRMIGGYSEWVNSRERKLHTMYIDSAAIITIASVLGALTAIGAVAYKIIKWFQAQEKQTTDIEDLKKQEKEDIKAMEDELCLLTYAVLACLKGLKEQGCNGPVTEAIGKIEKHINQKAHGQET